jgi:microcystin-dependent protein
MAEPFLSEIRIASFGFAPQGWALCNGQLLPINQNQALFSLLGTTYGGDGRVNFALPDMRARVPIHSGNGHTLGERAGAASHTLSQAELPTHIHIESASTAIGTLNSGANNYLAVSQAPVYALPANLTTLTPQSVTNVGGSQAHLNQQPFLALNFIIALIGIFPSQT